MSFHDRRFPNESAEYRVSRDRLLQAEIDLRAKVEEVARMRRALPMGGPVRQDYVFEGMGADGRPESVRLSQLFSPGKPSLILYSYMYGPKMEDPCPMCTALVDGLNAMAPHVAQRANLAVAARSPIARITQFAKGRGWSRIRFLSSEKNTYHADYWSADEADNQYPMMNVFHRENGEIYHFWGSEMLYAGLDGDPRHVDAVWPLWSLFDLTPEGRGTDWYPRLSY